MFSCKRAGLEKNDLDDMTIGFCVDYIHEWVEQQNPKKEEKARQASQKDFDSF